MYTHNFLKHAKSLSLNHESKIGKRKKKYSEHNKKSPFLDEMKKRANKSIGKIYKS